MIKAERSNDTKVKYLIWFGFRRGSINPLYNADGSLQVYEVNADENSD